MALPKISSEFRAKWEPSIAHLKPIPDIASRPKNEIRNFHLKRLFIDKITFGLAPYIRNRMAQVGELAKANILPAAYETAQNKEIYKTNFETFWYGPVHHDNRALRAHFEASPHTIETPDGHSRLKATLFRHRDADESTPTLIYFQPNGCISTQEAHGWLLQKSIEKKTAVNIVVFDYRTVGESTGTFQSTNDLIVDGASIVQWVRKELRTPDESIHFYGYSLGGAIAAKTKALQSDQLTGHFISERSLSSSSDIISAFIHKELKPNLRPLFRPLCYLLAPLISWVVKNQGYGIDAVTAFKKLKGKKLVVYHWFDPVIPYRASLVHNVKKIPHLELALMHPAPGTVGNHHCEPLSSYENAEEEIARFLFNNNK